MTRAQAQFVFRAVLFILALIGGALMNRWRGMGSKYKWLFPRPLPQIVLSLPYAYAVLHAGQPWWVATIVFAITLMGWTTGHGAYFPSLQNKHITPERIDPIVRLFFGKDPRTQGVNPGVACEASCVRRRVERYGTRKLAYRCLFGMSLTGLVITIPAGIALHNPALAISGLLKGPMYQFAHRLGVGTEGGEFLTGAALIGSIVLLT